MGDDGAWKPRLEVRLLSDHITQTHAALKAQGPHTPTVLGALNLLRSQRESSLSRKETVAASKDSSELSDDSDDAPLSHKMSTSRADSPIGELAPLPAGRPGLARPPSHRSTRQRTFPGPAADVITTPTFSFPSPPRSLRHAPHMGEPCSASLIETPSSMMPCSPALKTFPRFEDILLNGKSSSCCSCCSSSDSSESDPAMLSVSTSLSLMASPSSSSSSSSPPSPRCESTSLTISHHSPSSSSSDNLDNSCCSPMPPSASSTPLAIKMEKPTLRKRPRRLSAHSSDQSDEDESHEFQTWGAHSAMLPQLTPPIKPMISTHKASMNESRSHAGSSCHQCKNRFSSKKRGNLVHCRQPPPHSKKSSVCKKKYCTSCLFKYYEEQPPQTTYWLCPSCRQICCCLLCWRAKCKADVALSPASALASALVFFPELLHSAMSGKDSSEDDSDSQEFDDRSSSSPSPSPPAPVPNFFPPDIPQIHAYAPELYPGFRPEQAYPFFPAAPDQFPMLYPPQPGPELSGEQKSLAQQEMEQSEEFQQQYQKAYHQHYERHYQQMYQQQFQQQQEMLLHTAKLAESHMEHFQKEGCLPPSSTPSVS